MTSSTAPGLPPPGQSEAEYETPSSDQVREQLARIVASPVFRNSKRYAAVLTYVVEQKLAGKTEHLKERTIGVDVFGREPDYDTGADHVVRSAMAEVRKRLGQYYQGGIRPGELCLDLQPGSYVPQFRGERRSLQTEPVLIEALPHNLGSPRRDHRFRWLAGALLGVCVPLLAFSLRKTIFANDPVGSFWSPVLASSGEALLCLGNLEGGKVPTAKDSPSDFRGVDLGDFHRLPTQTVQVGDATALARFVGLLQTRGKPWRIVAQSDATFSDLRNGPSILIGLMNNNWTEWSTGKLRYRVERVTPRRVVIQDTQNPSKQDWSLDFSTPVLNVTRDYALVLRYVDPNTDEPVVTAGGISVFGTQAAAEFLTDAREIAALNSLVPGWEKKNLEIVLTTEVVRAKSGRPRILAAYVW